MKQKKDSNLQLRKITLTDLDEREMKKIKGGDEDPKLTTITPVYCQP